MGRRSYQGGAFIGRLIKAVISFINRWTSSKQKLEVLIEKQSSVQKTLELGDGKDS